MTKEEAQKILDMRDKLQDSCCSCHIGNPPCGYCENMPSDDMIDEAEQIFLYEDNNDIHNDRDIHNDMTLSKLAEHLKVDLWRAMEIARWANIKVESVIEEFKLEQVRNVEAFQILVDWLVREGYTISEIYEYVATRVQTGD